MPDAVIVDAVRTPLGRRNGALKDWHPVDLAAHTLQRARRAQRPRSRARRRRDHGVRHAGRRPGRQRRAQRRARRRLPRDRRRARRIDRQCGSSQQAAHFAAQGVMAGAYDVVIAAGVESMTRVPMGASFLPGSMPFGPRVFERYDLVPQGISAELIAEKWGISREENDAFSVESHLRAARATEEGRFEREIVAGRRSRPTTARRRSRATRGSGPTRRVERLAQLKPAFKPDGGVITAANSSQITDGAAATLDHERGEGERARPHAACPVPHVRARRRRPGHHAHRPDPGDERRCSSART